MLIIYKKFLMICIPITQSILTWWHFYTHVMLQFSYEIIVVEVSVGLNGWSSEIYQNLKSKELWFPLWSFEGLGQLQIASAEEKKEENWNFFMSL